MRILLLLLCICLNSCIVQVLPRRGETDGRSELTDPELEKLTTNQHHEGLAVREISKPELSALARQEGEKWLVLWAPWCASCVANLDRYKLLSEKRQVELILISTNYNTKAISKILNGHGYQGVTYILNSYDFGEVEQAKLAQVRALINPADSSNILTAIPQHYILKSGLLVEYKVGGIPQLMQQ